MWNKIILHAVQSCRGSELRDTQASMKVTLKEMAACQEEMGNQYLTAQF